MNRAPLFLATLALAVVVPVRAAAQDTERGERLYEAWCAGCHGVEGRGDGAAAAYMLPRPRDFTLGLYQVRTTASGELPMDADLVRVIEEGMPGTAMPGWKSKFSAAEIRDLVGYIKGFSRFFEQLGEPTPLALSGAPRLSEEALAEGRRYYEEIECFKCHGELGRGDGPSAPTLQDDLDFPIRATDLTENWHFNGGGTTQDIYRTLRTGLDGSPMPSFSDLIEAGFMTDEQLWHVAQYVRSLSPEQRPRVRDVIGASRIEAEVPSSSDDPIWDDVEAYYIPLVGQIIEETRWFAPTVDGVWVQAAHDDREIALRVVWHDPSRSPDPAWLEWQGWVARTMYPLEDSMGAGLLPDRLVVQFPATITGGRERPYFLMGDSRRPVYLWQWTSEPDGAVEMRATGLGSQQPLSSTGQSLEWDAVWDRGEWRVVFKRELAAVEAGTSPEFPLGRVVPIAFFAWDGSNGERGSRAAISSWYNIYLEKPTPATVYVSPALAALLTAGLGVLVVWRAQRRESATEPQL